jgi:hypothetical protein
MLRREQNYNPVATALMPEPRMYRP